ncbi:MAG: Na+/proline symporter [Flammeovirgaceae bacterium]|jgi:SSS family solute:Na+ symporter
MSLHWLDWAVIATFLIVILTVGLRYTQQAGKSVESFFLGGRNLPWWIAGTSMVATTFAADTPLLITELVASKGISGNWLWWNALIGGMLTTFFFAKLWRRANIVTDVEFIELRYSGKPAAFLRGFKAIYLGVFLNAVIIAWVNLALMKLISVFFGIEYFEQLQYVAIAMLVVAIYSSLSGLLGVAITDFIQFIIAMVGCILLSIIVLNSDKVGGVEGLKSSLDPNTFDFFPKLDFMGDSIGETVMTYSISFISFFAFVGVQWWASWYPGAEPGGGGYVAQRMMSAKTEKDAIKATLFFQVAHYALRPWPWIIVALCALVLYPDLSAADKGLGFPMAMKEFLPVGLKGLLLVAFFAAYMSTISTQLNWGTSYLINDFYKRFFFKTESNPTEETQEKEQKQLVFASRIGTFIIMAVGLLITTQMQTMEGAFNFMIACGAGLGMVLILRWYWWRLNAWSEISATLAPFIPFGLLKWREMSNLAILETKLGSPIPQVDLDVFYQANWFYQSPYNFLITVAFTTIVWLAVTFLTKPTAQETLHKFYHRIQPQGAWERVRKQLDLPKQKSEIGSLLLLWLAGVILVYSCLFLIGELIFGELSQAMVYALFFVGSGIFLWKKV